MLLSAVQKSTLLDYPGKIATIVFTFGCNLRCRYCHNPEFALPEHTVKMRESIIPEEVFFRFLETRKGFLDGVVICGGEPTIHHDLPVFCRTIKNMGFLVKLDTNGSNPDMLESLFSERLVDSVAMDVKHAPGKYSDLVGGPEGETRYDESIRMIMETSPDYEFRTTIVKGVHSEGDLHTIGERIRGAKRFALQNYRPDITLDPAFIGLPFSSGELEDYKQIMEKYVEECIVRE